MSPLMWLLPWLPAVLSAWSQLPKPVNIMLIPGQYSHTLKWEPGAGTPAEAYYSVGITTERGLSEDPVAGCQHVQHSLVCNLTAAFSDPVEVYIPLVRALLGAQASDAAFGPRIKPINHMGLPLLTVAPCGRNLCVALQPPMEHLRNVYDLLSYKLQIESNDDAKFTMNIRSLGGQTLEHLAPGTQYCVSVSFDDSLEGLTSNFSRPVCAFTSGAFPAEPWVFAVSSLFLMTAVTAAVTVAVLLLYTGSICLKKQPLPPVLTSVHHIDGLIITPWKTSTSSILSITSMMYCATEKTHRSSLTDQSDDESETESSGQSTGGAYKEHLGTSNLLFLSSSSSSSSTSSTSALLSTKPKKMPRIFSNPQSHFMAPASNIHTGTDSSAGLTSPASRDISEMGRSEADEDGGENTVSEEDSQDVNLLTLQFGRPEDPEKEDQHLTSLEDDSYLTDNCNAPPVSLSQRRGSGEVPTQCLSWVTDEEEVEDMDNYSEYIGRPQTLNLHDVV